jgi:flagellar hook-associated protein 2
MPVTMGGMASGIDTDGIIEKLVKVEAQPIAKLQNDKQEFSVRKQALQNLGSLLNELQKSAKELYGFRSSYEDKKAISSNPGIIEAIPSSHAEKGVKYITVKRMAGNHKIISDTVAEKFDIPAGKFKIEVNGDSEVINFRGGTIDKLSDKISEQASRLVNVEMVKTAGDKFVLSLESKIPGEKGEIKISGDKDLLKKVGIVKGEKNAEKNKLTIIFDTKNFTPYEGKTVKDAENGNLSVSPDGKSMNITGVLWREFTLPAEKELKKDSFLEITTEFKSPEEPEKEDESLPYKIKTGPQENTVIKGIELKSYNISRDRLLERPPVKKNVTDILGVGVVYTDETGRQEKIYQLQKDAKGVQEIPVGEELAGKKIGKVIFYCNDGEVRFQNAAIVTPEKGKDLLEPKNTISEAKNALMKVDGVDIERDKNEGIVDVIKGVTLNIKGANENEKVILTIDNDIDKAIGKIKKFVEVYNKYLEMHSQLTRSVKTEKPDDFDKVKSDSGLFVGDMTLVNLQNQLRTTVSNAYPSRTERPIRIFSEVGVSTGAINSAWETIKEGKLVVDEDKLRTQIVENPAGVRDLFGSDNDGDNRIDNGLGYTVEYVLDPYVRPGKNIIAAKISYQDDEMKNTDERIARLQEHVKSYEQKLRTKFANMEKAVSGAKSQKEWLKQQSGGQ